MSYEVADGVTGDGRGDDEGRNDDDVHVALGGHDAGDEDRRLPGQDEADEKRRLAEDQQRHQTVDQWSGQLVNLVQEVRDDGRGEHLTILVDNQR